MRPRLLALDLDGTLVRCDGSISDADRDAIFRARAAGVVVTIVTGRIGSGAVPIARELGLEAIMACADGAQLIDPLSLALIEHESVPAPAIDIAISAFRARSLAPFALTDAAIHAEHHATPFAPWVRGWSPVLELHEAWSPEAPLAILLGLGAEEPVQAVRAELDRSISDVCAVDAFPMGDSVWAVKLQSRRATKGRALGMLAARMGISRAEVAFVGDWHNDITALRWAGHSFCMGQAPSEVSRHAQYILLATHREGGGVAEVVARWW